MTFSKEILTSFIVFAGLFALPIVVFVRTISVSVALSVTNGLLVVATFATGYLFTRLNRRLPTRKEYFQMIGFGTFVYCSMLVLIFYKMYDIQFLKDIVSLLMKLEIAVWISLFVIILLPALMIAFCFAKIGAEDKGCDKPEYQEWKENLRSATLFDQTGERLLLSYGREVLIVSSKDPSNPVVITTYSLDNYVEGMFMLDTTTVVCYTKAECGKIMLLDLSNLQNITILISYDVKWLNTLIKVNENMLASAGGEYVRLQDVSNRHEFKPLGEYFIENTGGGIGELFVYDDILVCGRHITKLDISDPKKIKLINDNMLSADYYSFIRINKSTFGLCWGFDYGSHTFVLESLPDFKHLGGYRTESNLHSIILINQNTLAAISYKNIIMLDISNPEKIELLCEFDIDRYGLIGHDKIHRIVKINDAKIAYYGQSSLLFLDVSNRKQIREIGALTNIKD
jgi:hypothetical protein